jgi:hypothetical protein
MPTPTFTTSEPVTTHVHVHEVTTRTPDYIDLLTVLLPLLTFAAGYYLNSLVENRKEKKRLEEVKEYFLALIQAFVKSIKRQAEFIQDANDRLEALDTNNLGVGVVSSLRTTRLKAIPSIELYKIFIQSKKDVSRNVDRLNKISSNLDYIDDIRERIILINSGITSFANSFYKDYIEAINNVTTQNNQLSIDLINGVYGENYVLADLVLLVKEHVSYEARSKYDITDNIKAVHDLLAKPLYEAVRGVQLDEHNYDLMEAIQALEGGYKKLLHFKSHTIEELGVLAMKLNSAGTEIETVVAELTK